MNQEINSFEIAPPDPSLVPAERWKSGIDDQSPEANNNRPSWVTGEMIEYAEEARTSLTSKEAGSIALETAGIKKELLTDEDIKQQELEAAHKILETVDKESRLKLFNFGDKSAKYILAAEDPNEDLGYVEQLRTEAITAEQNLDSSISNIAADYRVHVVNAARLRAVDGSGHSEFADESTTSKSDAVSQKTRESIDEKSPEEQLRIKKEVQNILVAIDGARDSSSLNNTAAQIAERSRKVLEGDLKLAGYGTAIGASEDQRFIGDVFTKLLDPEIKQLFGDNYPSVRKMLSSIVRSHGDGMDARVHRGDERRKMQIRSDVSGGIMRNVMSGNYSRVADLTDAQQDSLRSVLLGIATGVSPREQRRNIANQLVTTLV